MNRGHVVGHRPLRGQLSSHVRGQLYLGRAATGSSHSLTQPELKPEQLNGSPFLMIEPGMRMNGRGGKSLAYSCLPFVNDMQGIGRFKGDALPGILVSTTSRLKS